MKAWLLIKNQFLKEYRKNPALYYLILVGSIAFGAAHGLLQGTSTSNIRPTAPSRQFQSEDTPDPKDVREELASIDLHNATSLDDYISRAMRVRALVPQMIAFYEHSRIIISSAKVKYQSKPNMLELANLIEQLNKKDEYGFQLLEDELRYAFQMKSLPKTKRQAFFDSNIVPLFNAENKVIQEEIDMVNDGIKRGLPLPPDIIQSLKTRLPNNK